MPAPPALPLIPPSEPGTPVAVGYSGGVDSTVLLHLLADAAGPQRSVRAIHVHHGLHPHADAWAEHCRATCAAIDIGLTVLKAEVRRDGGLGLEGAARQARYAAFERELHDGEVLALAHHRDDQAETVLLRALRASGPDGLAAMLPWRPFARGWLWRPLLALPRDALLAHARALGLRWIEDPGNRDTDLDRVFLRQRVLPLLRERWPAADVAFARAASLQAEAVALLDEEDEWALASARSADPHVLRADVLSTMPSARRARVLRRWIASLGLPPLPAQGIARVEADLLRARPDAGAAFAWAGAQVRRWRDLVHADVRCEALPGTWSATWSLDTPLELPTGDRLELHPVACGSDGSRDALQQEQGSVATPVAPTAGMPWRVHARRGGERIVLPGRRHSHSLKHVLQDLGVPPWERERLPLVSDADGRLLAAGDLAYSAAFDEWLRERNARLHWRRL